MRQPEGAGQLKLHVEFAALLARWRTTERNEPNHNVKVLRCDEWKLRIIWVLRLPSGLLLLLMAIRRRIKTIATPISNFICRRLTTTISFYSERNCWSGSQTKRQGKHLQKRNWQSGCIAADEQNKRLSRQLYCQRQTNRWHRPASFLLVRHYTLRIFSA